MEKSFSVANKYFSFDLDVSDSKVLQEAVNELKWDVNVEEVISDQSVKQVLIDNTNEAVNRGAFGVPR